MSKRPLANYYAAISTAIRADDIQAVPGLLVYMALDGYGHEAEQLRRELLLLTGRRQGQEAPDA